MSRRLRRRKGDRRSSRGAAHDEAHAASGPSESEGESKKGDGRTARLLGLAGVAIGVIAGTITLLFQVDPGLAPCLGGADASFTGAPVFPHVSDYQYLLQAGLSGSALATASQTPDGAIVSFSYHLSDLRGANIVVRYSLLTVERDGTVGPLAVSETGVQDENIDTAIQPDACEVNGGMDLFVELPRGSTRQNYKVVLELYRGMGYDERMALTQTEQFHG